MTGIIGAYPYLVCEADGKILAYAYAHRFHEEAAYQWDVATVRLCCGRTYGIGDGKGAVPCINGTAEAPECEKCLCAGNQP